MDKEMWDKRYSEEEYAYGTEPNEFFKGQIDILPPGRILLPAEGEGRNAVYAARLGWQVTAFDQSVEGRKKAMKLASENNVTIDYRVATIEDIVLEKSYFDAMAMIFVHISEDKQSSYINKMLECLRPGGVIIFQAYTKKQIEFGTGGPKEIDRLYSVDKLKQIMNGLERYVIEEYTVELSEGNFHYGKSAVVTLTGKK